MVGLAATLPFHVLVGVIAAARELDPVEWECGGKVGWDSNASVARQASVSSAWSEAANFCLYRSVVVVGGAQASLFLRTVRERPELAALVKSLVVGLEDDDEESKRNPGEESASLVEVIEACLNVTTLQVRPLHHSVRTRLLDAISVKPLEALVCSPRHKTTTDPLFQPTDIFTLATPTLQRLELDSWTFPAPSHALPTLPPLALIELRLFCSNATEAVFQLISAAGPTLEVLDLYSESIVEPSKVVAALSPSTPTLRRLSYISNPPASQLLLLDPLSTPPLDLLLPHFERLTHLSVSATDLSPNLFRVAPASLRHVNVQSLSHFPQFFYSQETIVALGDWGLEVRLESLTVRDGAWREKQVEAMDRACAARGVSFLFEAD